MSRVVFGQFVLLVLLTLLPSERKRFKMCLKNERFLHCSIFRLPNNLRERAIGMLVLASRRTRCKACWVSLSSDTKSSHKISNDRKHQRLATSWTSACYIMNMHLRNRFQTATATAANTPNNRISTQTVRNRLRENGLHDDVPTSDAF